MVTNIEKMPISSRFVKRVMQFIYTKENCKDKDELRDVQVKFNSGGMYLHPEIPVAQVGTVSHCDNLSP